MNDDEFKDTEIGRIPKEWEVNKLSDIVIKAKMGGTPRRDISEYWNGNIYFAKAQDISKDGKYLYKAEEFITEKGLENSSTWLVPENSLLLSAYGSIGFVKINKVPVAINQQIIGIMPNEKIIDVEFLYNWYLNYKSYWDKFIKTTTLPHLTLGIVLDRLIPFPPLEEQKKIAYVLSKIQKAIELQDRLIKLLQELKKTMMHKLFTEGIGHTEFKDTEIGRIPKDWEIRRIKDISLKIKAGGTPSRKEIKYWGGNIPFVLINDIVNSSIYLYKTKEFITELGLKNSSTWIVPPNSLLVSIYATIGEVVINKIPVATNQAIIAIVPMPDFNVEYGLYAIKYYKNILYKQIVQTTQKNINKAIFQNLTVPLPHLEEQKKIANILLTIDNKISLEENRKDLLEKLFKTMLNKLMTGQIRVKDLNVEVFGV
ncbi:MAG: restriction endonuclease subunit S [Caldisericum sp.]|uniref:restriction endonuclease subunit S n=1 Tax=Caldisericum sp. TaxID=2499687 RepID=UPI003D11C45B